MNATICGRSQQISVRNGTEVIDVDYDDSAEEADFRTRLRRWLAGSPDRTTPASLWETEATHEYKTKWLS